MSFSLPSNCSFSTIISTPIWELWVGLAPQAVVLCGDSQGSSEDNSTILAWCSGELHLWHTKYSGFHWIFCLYLCSDSCLQLTRVTSAHCHLFCMSEYFSVFFLDTWTARWDLIGSGKWAYSYLIFILSIVTKDLIHVTLWNSGII